MESAGASVNTVLAFQQSKLAGDSKMNIIRWEPFREVEEVLRQYSPFFNRGMRRTGGEAGEWTPVADISETDKEYVIKAELPEVRKEDVKVTLDGGVITISGERKHQKEQKDANEIRIESFYGTFSRSFSLPENASYDDIRCESKDGVLTVHIPKVKVEAPKAKQIKVE